MRLEDILFTQGFGTRHECSGLVSLGRVTFDGVLSTDPDSEVNPQGKCFLWRVRRGRIMRKPSLFSINLRATSVLRNPRITRPS